MFCLPSYWMAIFLALAYGHLTLLSFGSHTGAGREEKGLGEILGTHLSRSESGCSWFQKDFLPPIRGRSGISFKLDLSLHRWKDLVALMYAQSTSAGQDRTGTGQSTVLFQELRICWIKNIIPGFISAADLGRMVCQCTVADIYCIWLHFNEQRTSCFPPTPTRFSPSPVLMIPWVWSSSVEVIFSSGMLVRSCQLQIALLKVQKQKSLPVTCGGGFFPFWISGQ